MASADVMTFTDDNFQSEVLGVEGAGAGGLLGGVVRALPRHRAARRSARPEHKGKLKVGKLDIDAHQNVPQKYGVMSIPTLLLFKDGQVADQIVGAVPKAKLDAMVKRAI